jgi:hypothetical protein
MVLWQVYFPLFYPATPLIILDPYIYTRYPKSQLNKGIRSIDLRITDIYIIVMVVRSMAITCSLYVVR